MKKLLLISLIYAAIYLVATISLGATTGGIVFGAILALSVIIVLIVQFKKNDGGVLKKLYLILVLIVLAVLIYVALNPDILKALKFPADFLQK